MLDAHTTTIAELVAQGNSAKQLFTAGPASLLAENLMGLRPCFGRNDIDYDQTEQYVLDALRAMSGHSHLVRMQGSASLALEIAIRNFTQGRILVIQTGAYSQRLHELVQSARSFPAQISTIDTVPHQDLQQISGRYDWIVACYTETSIGLKLSIEALRQLADRTGARLLLDATASIGLEPSHELADVIAYSSCKGLFGLTGAAFIASHVLPGNLVSSFYLDYHAHAQKRMTGPYHAMLSLEHVLRRHEAIRESVRINKALFMRRFEQHLVQPPQMQPQLCTHVSCGLHSKRPSVLLYASRYPVAGSIVCHLGEAHLGEQAEGAILDSLEIAP